MGWELYYIKSWSFNNFFHQLSQNFLFFCFTFKLSLLLTKSKVHIGDLNWIVWWAFSEGEKVWKGSFEIMSKICDYSIEIILEGDIQMYLASLYNCSIFCFFLFFSFARTDRLQPFRPDTGNIPYCKVHKLIIKISLPKHLAIHIIHECMLASLQVYWTQTDLYKTTI